MRLLPTFVRIGATTVRDAPDCDTRTMATMASAMDAGKEAHVHNAS